MNAFITVVGLGPGDPAALTREAWEVLAAAEEVHFRTLLLPGVGALPSGYTRHSFDHLYEELDEYSQIYQAIVDRLLQLAHQSAGVVYAVPGDPTVGEATVHGLLEGAAAGAIKVRLVHGISFIEPCLGALQLDALDGLAIADALSLAANHHPPFAPDQPALIGQLHLRQLATDVKLTLMNQYPDDHEVAVVRDAMLATQRVERMPLYQLDHAREGESEFNALTTLFVPPLLESSSFEALQDVVAHLRAPEGCPWDREQTHQSLRRHLMEEAYETLGALDSEDMAALREELGDLLLQIVLQAQIATESGDFQMADVIAGIRSKLLRRHPHVFSDLEVEGVDQVLRNWEHLKEAERDLKGDDAGLFDGLPEALPSLAQAAELQDRASRMGFDWPSIEGVLAKVAEEVREIEGEADPARKASELGDLLFALVNYARWIHVDAESELRSANLRFRLRFQRMGELAQSQGKRLEQLSLAEMDELWEKAKEEGP